MFQQDTVAFALHPCVATSSNTNTISDSFYGREVGLSFLSPCHAVESAGILLPLSLVDTLILHYSLLAPCCFSLHLTALPSFDDCLLTRLRLAMVYPCLLDCWRYPGQMLCLVQPTCFGYSWPCFNRLYVVAVVFFVILLFSILFVRPSQP